MEKLEIKYSMKNILKYFFNSKYIYTYIYQGIIGVHRPSLNLGPPLISKLQVPL